MSSDCPSIQCRCGKVDMSIEMPIPDTSARITCYCKDCRAFSTHLGAEEDIGTRGASDLLHVAPRRLRFCNGAEHMDCLRLSPKGLFRWYAACCNSPMFVTLPKDVPFISVVVPRMVDVVPPDPVATVFSEQALDGQGPLPVNHGRLTVVVRFFRRIAGALLTGHFRSHPLFEAGKPMAEPTVLSLEERKAATRLP